jgi:hypothetical protein
MRSGNSIDGMYFLFIVIPFALSFWIGDLLRKKLIFHLVLESYCSQNFSTFIGIMVEIIIIITGTVAGLFLIKLL